MPFSGLVIACGTDARWQDKSGLAAGGFCHSYTPAVRCEERIRM